MLEIPYRLEMIPYENISLRSLYFTHKTKTCKGTLFICGGFDALLEELYFTNVVAGIEEGYNVIIFEDQVNPLSLENIIFHLSLIGKRFAKP